MNSNELPLDKALITSELAKRIDKRASEGQDSAVISKVEPKLEPWGEPRVDLYVLDHFFIHLPLRSLISSVMETYFVYLLVDFL